MPILKSAKKALRVSFRRHEENLIKKSDYKQSIRDFKKAAANSGSDLTKLYNQVQKTLDKAAQAKAIHSNKAARLKSRLSKHLKSK